MAHGERKLVVFRHAKSAWPAELADVERPLNERGLRDAPVAGKWLRRHVPDIDLVVCSPAARARATWELASAEAGDDVLTRHDERVYGATAGELIALINEVPDSARTVALVGHNPGLTDLVTVLTGSAHELKTSAIAVLVGSGPWSDVQPGWARLVASTRER